jgi:hypothetical protein
MQPGVLDPRITFTRASTASYFDSAGVMRTATTNTPRWDYDPPTLTLRGLLIEEARENRTLQSADLSNAAWQKAGANGPAAPTVTGNQAVAPDGTTTASRVALPAISGAGAVSFVQQPLAAGASVALWTFSIYLKGSVGGEQTYICIYDAIANYIVKQRVTLTTSWQRYVVTSPSNLTTAAWYSFIGTDLRDAGEASTPAATIYAWGAQFEQGAFATSYIPTTSAAVTRAADACSMPAGSWYNATQGSLACEYIVKGNAPSYGAPIGFVGANSDNDHIIPDRRDAGGTATAPTINTAIVQANGAVSGYAAFAATPTPAGELQRGAIAWAVSSPVKAAHNGVTWGNIQSTTTLPVITSLSLVGVPSGQPRINLWLRATRYYARVLTDAEMQTVTTP